MKVHRYVLRRLFRDEYARFIGRLGANPIAGLDRVLKANKIGYESVVQNEITFMVGDKKLVVKQED